MTRHSISAAPDAIGSRTASFSTGPRKSSSLAANLRSVGEGDRAAFAQVYRHTSRKLFGVCLRVLGDRSEAEDALQEVFIKVWQKASAFDSGRSSPVTWLATLARNTAIDGCRARTSRPCQPLTAEALAIRDPSASAPETLQAAEQSRLVASWIAQLDARQASAIRGAFFGGATYSELAAREGVPLGTMKSWVRRGLASLSRVGSISAAAEEEHGLPTRLLGGQLCS